MADPDTSPGGADVPERTACAWCRRRRWPDLCGTTEAYCSWNTDHFHSVGDHRQCGEDRCDWAARWTSLLHAAAINACRASGKRYAILSIVDADEPTLLATFDTIEAARAYRVPYGEARGLAATELPSQIPILTAHGGFL
jgi:hypothetical protein